MTLATGDAPFNLITGITLTDATGQPVQQPISGYNLYAVNKYLPGGSINSDMPRPYSNPQLSPEYNYAVTGGTAGTATWRLQIEFEQDYKTGYGCIPNLDSNASLQLKVDYGLGSLAFSGTLTGSTISMRVSQEYWAPVSSSMGGAPVAVEPPGAGDYVETRYETQTVSASAENTVALTNKGGLIKGVIFVSRVPGGARIAYTAGANFGQILDNQPITEGIPIEEHYDLERRMHGYFGADLTTTYAPLTAGVNSGLDRGVVPVSYWGLSGGRDSWLATRVGSLYQVKFTPGATATQLEIITQIAQVKDPAAFYAR
jgi:hypothetical protein